MVTELFHISKRQDYYYSAMVLSQVMRCSENIFRIAYNVPDDYYWGSSLKPVMGHKIQGPEVTTIIDEHCAETLEEARKILGNRIGIELQQLCDNTNGSIDIAVVVNSVVDPQKNGEFMNNLLESSDNIKYRISCSLIDWNDTSSMEWSVVIYGTCIPLKHQRRFLEQLAHVAL